jgi:hypothetical protein
MVQDTSCQSMNPEFCFRPSEGVRDFKATYLIYSLQYYGWALRFIINDGCHSESEIPYRYVKDM